MLRAPVGDVPVGGVAPPAALEDVHVVHVGGLARRDLHAGVVHDVGDGHGDLDALGGGEVGRDGVGEAGVRPARGDGGVEVLQLGVRLGGVDRALRDGEIARLELRQLALVETLPGRCELMFVERRAEACPSFLIYFVIFYLNEWAIQQCQSVLLVEGTGKTI